MVGAVGRPQFIKGDWIADGAVVVDAGYHPGGVGDIELSAVQDRCSAFTPVPGGVRPMTIATPIAQNAEAAERLSALRKRLRGDLDNILLKALQKGPSQRYSSADKFSSCLQV